MPRVLNDNKSYFYMSDISVMRLEKTNENIIRLGLDGDDLIKLYVADAREKYPSDFLGKMDIVICDVPCSGLGTIKSKPDIKYHLNHQKIMDLLPLQAEILNNASSLLKKETGQRKNSRIIYSTCTINPRENQEQVKRFLEENKALNLVCEFDYLFAPSKFAGRRILCCRSSLL